MCASTSGAAGGKNFEACGEGSVKFAMAATEFSSRWGAPVDRRTHTPCAFVVISRSLHRRNEVVLVRTASISASARDLWGNDMLGGMGWGAGVGDFTARTGRPLNEDGCSKHHSKVSCSPRHMHASPYTPVAHTHIRNNGYSCPSKLAGTHEPGHGPVWRWCHPASAQR